MLILLTWFQDYPVRVTTLVTDMFRGFRLSVCECNGKHLQVYHRRHVYTMFYL